MTAEELQSIAYRRPFRPFRVTLRSGERIDISRSLRASVTPDLVVFGTNEDPDTGVAKRMRIVALKDIESIEVRETA